MPKCELEEAVTVSGGATVEATAGDVFLQATDGLALLAASTVKSDLGNVSLTAGSADNDADAGTTIQGLISGTGPALQGGSGPQRSSSLLVDYTAGASLPKGLAFNGVANSTLSVTDQHGTGRWLARLAPFSHPLPRG